MQSLGFSYGQTESKFPNNAKPRSLAEILKRHLKMKSEIKYIELKSNYSHYGPAWIGLVFFSKTGKTIYFNGKAFQRIGSSRIRGNFYDIETMEEYWISGVKKNMSDRHKLGNGKIQVERRIIE